MSCPKDSKHLSKHRAEPTKPPSRTRHGVNPIDKQNIVVDYIRAQKPKASKNLTATCHYKKEDEFEKEYNSRKKLRNENTGYKPLLSGIIKSKHEFNATLDDKRGQKREFLVTADITSTIKALNRHAKLSTLLGSKLKKETAMTEEDINQLFESGNYNHPKASGKNSKMEQIKRILDTEPDLQNQNPNNEFVKDYADSIKYLELNESQDRLLSALNDEHMIKVQPEKNVDKTAKFKERFIVGKQIGQGAYASVRVAVYTSLNKKVAIKIYQKKKIKEPQRKKSVRREIKILQQATHRNIVKIYDVIQTNNHINLIMEYVPGVSLASFLKSQPDSKLHERQARKLFEELVEAVVYLHSINICHRDIKLQNVLLDYQLSPKLIDFGFATCIQGNKKVKMYCGTPSFMAPEIVCKQQYRGSPADIWALGVLLFVTVTGVFPFKGHTDKQLYARICNLEHPNIDGLSGPLQDLIKRMLVVDAKQRITGPEILKHEWMSKAACHSQQKRSSTNVLQQRTYNQDAARRKTEQSKERKAFALTDNPFNLKEMLRKVNQSSSPKAKSVFRETPTPIQPIYVNLMEEAPTPPPAEVQPRVEEGSLGVKGLGRLTNKIYF